MHNIHYLETSAINIFADELNDFEFNEFLQKALKIDFCISSIGLWEILLNSDKSRKEKLILWAQFNCADYLLKSPTEIIVSFLQAGSPLKDRKRFWFDRATSMSLSETWKRIHRQNEKTILVDLSTLVERTEPLRQLSKMHRSLLESMTDKTSNKYEEEYFHRMMVQLRKSLGASSDLARSDEKLIKTSLILAFFLVCIGIELDITPVREFWKSSGVDDPFDRLEHLVRYEPLAIVRGPIIEMALMVQAQTEIENSANRGTLFDALHTIYCYYADNVISNDPHFTALRESKRFEIFGGIIPAEAYVKLMKDSYEKLTSA